MEESFILPNIPDVHLSKPPVNEVICQLRFPPIVKLGISIDPDFQDEIRTDYPYYDRLINNSVVNDQIVKKLQFPSDQLNHEFVNQTQNQKINIMQNFIALSTTAYDTWDRFQPEISSVFNIFEKHYKPALFTRTGLRYINLLTSDILPGLYEQPLAEFINKDFLGPIADKMINNPNLLGYSSNLQITDRQDITIQYGIGAAWEEQSPDISRQNRYFYIDIDVYQSNKKDLASLDEILNEAHKIAYNALRLVVTDGTINSLS